MKLRKSLELDCRPDLSALGATKTRRNSRHDRTVFVQREHGISPAMGKASLFPNRESGFASNEGDKPMIGVNRLTPAAFSVGGWVFARAARRRTS